MNEPIDHKRVENITDQILNEQKGGTQRISRNYKSVCYFSTTDSNMDLLIKSTVRLLIYQRAGVMYSNLCKPQSDKGSMSVLDYFCVSVVITLITLIFCNNTIHL